MSVRRSSYAARATFIQTLPSPNIMQRAGHKCPMKLVRDEGVSGAEAEWVGAVIVISLVRWKPKTVDIDGPKMRMVHDTGTALEMSTSLGFFRKHAWRYIWILEHEA